MQFKSCCFFFYSPTNRSVNIEIVINCGLFIVSFWFWLKMRRIVSFVDCFNYADKITVISRWIGDKSNKRFACKKKLSHVQLRNDENIVHDTIRIQTKIGSRVSNTTIDYKETMTSISNARPTIFSNEKQKTHWIESHYRQPERLKSLNKLHLNQSSAKLIIN